VILEHFADNSEELTLSNYGMLLWGNINHAFSQATMGYADGSNLDNGLFTVRGWNNPHLVTYMESHDEERIMYRALNFGNSNSNYTVKNLNVALRRMEMSTAFLLSMPGPKMIWQFGELGYDYSINTCENGSVSDNCRLASKPIRWDYQQSFQRNRLFEMNSAMLKLRQHPAYKAAFASNRVDQNLAPLVKSMRLTTDTSNLVVVGNFDLISQSMTIAFPGGGTYYDYLTGTTLSTTGSPQSISLEPGEYHVYLNRNITNVLTPVLDIPGTDGQLKLSVDPNPAGHSSIVSYELPLSGPVDLTLINSQGVKVGALSYSYRATGKYRINLYDMIKSARSLSKGIYFLRLNFKSYSTVISIFIK
jgi:hypothetical protein